MSKRILFCWELGANYGHLARLIPLAAIQKAAGNEVFFIINNKRLGEEVLTAKGFTFALTPKLPAIKAAVAANYAELLLSCGYANQFNLQVAVGEWLQLIKQFKPDLLVIDHSPTVLLANKILALPVMQIGAGFEMPPLNNWTEMVALNDQQKSKLKQIEALLLNKMNQALMTYSGQAMESNVDLFDGCDQLLITYPELDHYQNRENGQYFGHISYQMVSATVAWRSVDKKKVLIYLWPQMAGLYQLLIVLAEMDTEVIAVVPGISEAAMNKLSSTYVHIYNTVIDITLLAKDADLLITHGIGTVSLMLRQGIPVLLIPKTLEHVMLGQCIEANGYGLMMHNRRGKSHFEKALTLMFSTSSYRMNAEKFAEKYKDISEQHTLDRVSAVINRKLK